MVRSRLSLVVVVGVLAGCPVTDTVLENARCDLAAPTPCGVGTSLVCDPVTNRCVLPEHLSPPSDAGVSDAGGVDAGVADAGGADAGVSDAGLTDAGAPDAGPADAGSPDAGSTDAGSPDGGTDAGVDGGTDAGLVCGPTRVRVIKTPDGGYPNTVVVADLNADGRQDIAFTNFSTNRLGIAWGTDAGFSSQVTLTSPCGGPSGLFAGSFFGDAGADLFALCAGDNAADIYRGESGFNSVSVLSVDPIPRAMAVGRLNGDGDLDYVTVSNNFVTSNVRDSSTGYQMRAQTGISNAAGAVALADVTDDGLLDAIVTNADLGNQKVVVFPGNGQGDLGAPLTTLVNSCTPNALATADFDGDGSPDLVTTCRDGTAGASVAVLLSHRDGGFAPAPTLIIGQVPWGLLTGDFDFDGKQDLLVGRACLPADYGHCPPLTFLPGLGTGSFGTARQLDAGGDDRALASADLNGDGAPDLVVVNSYAETITVVLSGGPGCTLFP